LRIDTAGSAYEKARTTIRRRSRRLSEPCAGIPLASKPANSGSIGLMQEEGKAHPPVGLFGDALGSDLFSDSQDSILSFSGFGKKVLDVKVISQ
jgi:hypothetical protein